MFDLQHSIVRETGHLLVIILQDVDDEKMHEAVLTNLYHGGLMRSEVSG